jgi:hypothetical protein
MKCGIKQGKSKLVASQGILNLNIQKLPREQEDVTNCNRHPLPHQVQSFHHKLFHMYLHNNDFIKGIKAFMQFDK